VDKGAASRRAVPGGAAFAEWRAPDGWACRRLDWLQPADRDARGSLLFAAGRGDFIEKYLEIYAWWHAAGWNVTAFDWRGQGRSRGTIKGGNLLSFDILIEDLGAPSAMVPMPRSVIRWAAICCSGL
jgi:lysophospholipase